MRVKTEAKRLEILAAAAAEFSARGYHETTLSHVAARMGSSKATIYNYFPTKGELFGSMLAAAAIPATAALLEHLDQDGTLADRLTAFATAFIRQQTGERSIALQRLLISENGKSPDTMRPLHETAGVHIWSHVADLIRAEQARGRLCAGDAVTMVRQWCALLQGDLPLRLLFGERDCVSESEIVASAEAATAFFLAAFGNR